MRALFLLLLLANLLFVAWTRWVAPAPIANGRATPVAAQSPAIRLLREAPLAGDASPAVTASAPVCVSAGPYVDQVQADEAVARLLRLGFAARIRAARDEVRVGQWVRIENLATPEDAANALAVIRGAGIADAYVLLEEGSDAVISLGVFADEARANQAIGVARRAGFDPQVVEHSRLADVFWLDIDRNANAGLPALEDLQGTAATDAPPLELRPCPQTGDSTAAEGPSP